MEVSAADRFLVDRTASFPPLPVNHRILMALISIENLSIGFRGPPLLDEVSCKIEPQQRIGLLGRNGAGKTTLLRMLAGEVEPDHGEVLFQPNTRVAWLRQDVPRNVAGRVEDCVASDLRHGEAGAMLEPWEIEHRIEQTLDRVGLDGDWEFATLSSGMKRRVLLARALAADPHVLLLDEPTNHLDISSILWLEAFLGRWPGTLIFITHDRSFLRNLADRIWEIDRGKIFDWSCDYETFLKRKEEALAAEEKQQALFDKKLAEEEAWIRQGIKARRTRNEGRVRALKAMREERQQRRTGPGTAKLQIQEAMRSGALVADVKNISFAYEDRTIVKDFSTTIMRGDKVGIIGPNGAGKTTLLRLLLGKLEPQSGSVRIGTKVEVAYFDQLREQLDPQATVLENVAEGTDRVTVGGKTKHIIGYLQDFLFSPERARTEVRFLSGGERNRVLLARLMTKPANVLVLDEPTNDLDSETLELLEEQVSQFSGTVLLVSHDRTFLNNVVTSTIVFEPAGVHEYDGGYDDWQRVAAAKPSTAPEDAPPAKAAPPPSAPPPVPTKKLSYKDQRELEQLPEQIEQLEGKIGELHGEMADPGFYKQPAEAITRRQADLNKLEAALAAAYARWEELEAAQGG